MVDRLGVLVEQNLDRHRLAIEVDVHARGFALAIVGHQHVLPLVQRDGLRGLHANSQVREAAVMCRRILPSTRYSPCPMPSK